MDVISTPASRKGPSSRLLQRRTLVINDWPTPGAITPKSAKPVSKSVSVVNESLGGSFMASPGILESSRPNYSYQARRRSIEGKSDVDALLVATGNLFVDFMSSCAEKRSNIAEMLDMVGEFDDLLSDHVTFIQSAIERQTSLAQNGNVKQVQENLKCERSTWRLLGKLFGLKGSQEGQTENDDEDMEDSSSKVLTEKTVVEALFDRDQGLQRAQAIVDWLELNARDDMSMDDNAYGDALIGWESTLHSLLLKGSKKGDPRLVKELDPDAKRRMRGRLHDDDEKDEGRLLKLLFFLLRAGMLERAQQLCVEMGQPWRAATLVGWQLYHDPNLGQSHGGGDGGDRLPAMGNPRRDVWKKSAWHLSNDQELTGYERAIYSTLCGNAHQLLSVCVSWEDMVWALVKSMVDVLVEKELRSSLNRSFISLPEAYWSNMTKLDEILKAVSNSKVGSVQTEVVSPYRIVQTYLMLGEWEKLSQALIEWSSTEDPQLLRFLCHLAMILGDILNVNDNENVCKQTLLESYIAFLIKTNRVDQIAWYCSKLASNEAQVNAFVAFLENLNQEDDRVEAMNAGFDHGLPMKDIRFEVTDRLVSCHIDDDDFKIKALDWLMYEPKERIRAMYKSNALIRYFIAERKVEKASEVLAKAKKMLPGDDTLDEEMLRELKCLELFIQTKEAFTDWFEFCHKAKPKEPTKPPSVNTDYTARVAYEQNVKHFEAETRRWQDSLLLQSHEVTARLEALLTYPGGWLMTEEEDESISEEMSTRIKEMNYLRRICIVESVFLLHTVFHSTKQFKEAVKISDIVAAEETAIYSLFSKEDMKNFLEKLKESSVALLEAGSDPWGYPKS